MICDEIMYTEIVSFKYDKDLIISFLIFYGKIIKYLNRAEVIL